MLLSYHIIFSGISSKFKLKGFPSLSLYSVGKSFLISELYKKNNNFFFLVTIKISVSFFEFLFSAILETSLKSLSGSLGLSIFKVIKS